MTAVRNPPRATVPEPRRRIGLAGWVKGQSIATTARVMHVVLWSAIAVVAVAALAAFFRPAPKPAPVKVPASTSGAEGFAELYVSTYLTVPANDPALNVFWPGRADLGLHSPVPGAAALPVVKVLRTAALDPVELAPSYWSVTVAAVTQVADGATVTRFFRVPVMRTEQRAYVAATLPAEVAAPLGARLPVLAVDVRDPEARDPMVGTVARFLGALLTGEGALTDYLAPGATVRAVRPAPYTAIEVIGLGTRNLSTPQGHVEVLVDAVGTDASGRVFPLTYPLQMSQREGREGRWEVVAIRAAPTIPRAQPAGVPTTVASPTVSVPVPTTTPAPTTTVTPTTLRRN